MSDWFEWRGENFYAVRGEELYYCGCVIKRMGVDRWDAWAHGERAGVFVSELAARRRVEEIVRGTRPAFRGPARSRAGTLHNMSYENSRGGGKAGEAGGSREPRRRFRSLT